MDSSLIIAASAVVWPAATYMFGRRHGGWYAREEIRKLKNGIACRDRKLSDAEHLETQLRRWLDERDYKIGQFDQERNASMTEIANLRHDNDRFRSLANGLANENAGLITDICELRRQLEAAGKPDQPRDPITGRWLSKEAA